MKTASILKRTFMALSLCLIISASQAQNKLRVCVAGLNHDHIHLILSKYRDGKVDLAGIAEPDKRLWVKFGKIYHIPDSLFFTDLKQMVIAKKPDAVLGYNAVAHHVDIVEICAPLHIPVMVEKPLAATLDQAKRIEHLSNQYNTPVLVNFETTWYASYKELYDKTSQDSVGKIRKMVFHDGHQGPREIGCSEDFLKWLTDPIENGAGALNDFGCYGADLTVWLMHGQRPIAVTAITHQYKPDVYPKVDDDATILVEYPTATAQINGSWNWPYSIKDMEIFGETGYYHAFDMNAITSRMRENKKNAWTAKPLAAPYDEPLNYLYAVLHHQIAHPENDQPSLKYNMIVMEILDAAKRSAKEGKKIVL